MSKLPPAFYSDNPEIVARKLLGRDLFVMSSSKRIIKAKLCEIAAYVGETKKSSKETRGLPGTLTIRTKMRQKLIEICTIQGKEPSSVTLCAANIEYPEGFSFFAQDSGMLSRKLGITSETERFYQSQEMYGAKIWIEGEPVPFDYTLRRDGSSENCIGVFYYTL